jgi:hypothetical protein
MLTATYHGLDLTDLVDSAQRTMMDLSPVLALTALVDFVLPTTMVTRHALDRMASADTVVPMMRVTRIGLDVHRFSHHGCGLSPLFH